MAMLREALGERVANGAALLRRVTGRGLRIGITRSVFLLLLAVIWLGLPLISESSGLRFGFGYQAYFTAMLALAALLFWLLSVDDVPLPSGALGSAVGFAGVLLVTVGTLVFVGVVYPQFEVPEPPVDQATLDAAGRGEALYWSDRIGCFRCHSIEGTGGTRGPDLTEVASRAGERVAGLGEAEYLADKVGAGGGFAYTVPEYVPMMPAFEKLMDEQELDDLVQFLLTLQ